MPINVDVAIVGAGPAGLCFAKSLADAGLKTLILERQAETSISAPDFDGREIALTHYSAQLMQELGLWARIDANEISPLRDARIFNGSSLHSLNINHRDTPQGELGYLISNHLIRKAAYDAAKSSSMITIKSEVQITSIKTSANSVELTLDNSESIQTKLLVGADSRFSETRRAMGIAADMHDFGKVMMVCVMDHPVSHEHAAWEWFDYGQTLALLPMNGMRSSVVVTLPKQDIDRLMKMQEEDFNREISARFQHRLGQMHLTSTRHAYPLITVYSKRLIGPRFALVGDAAVGMHPVTAHGFNFGLKGIATLSTEIKAALAANKDIAAESLLMRYEQAHRRHTRPLYLATHAIAKLYGNDSHTARLLRSSALRLGSRISPFKRAVAGLLA
ncbi:2-octaprenylphenol hydroxylase [mine drainage metagenome]|uniref:2-octaprenylphenol hydroxylase n=1 Tax=mine drainage metagenome TaxID=410659 RepID=A0A1J5RWA1_9ZZZZ